MIYLLCFGDNCFSVFDFDKRDQALRCADKWISEERFLKCVVCLKLFDYPLKLKDEEE